MTGPVVTYWPNLVDPQGSEWAAPDWETVLTRLSVSRPYQGDKEHPGWSPARLDPCQRAAENVKDLCGLCLDFDGGVSIDWALDKFAQFYGLLQTTRKHTPEVHRFRIVLPLSRRVSPFEHGELWKRVAHWCGNVNPSCKDAGRFWFLPGVKDGGEFRAERLKGETLNVAAWLSRPLPQLAPVVTREMRNAEPGQAEQRALRYIAKMPDAVSGQHGHDATWQVACVLACGFDLSEETTFQILWTEYNSRCQPAWSEKELRHKAKHARQNSRLERGYLLRETRDWVPTQRVAAPAPVDPEPEPDQDADFEAPENYEGTIVAREPGDDTEEIAKAPAFEVIEAPQRICKPIHERFGLFTERQLIRQVFDHVNSEKPKKGFTIGVPEIDQMLGGLRFGMIACVGAQTSWGKSSLATMTLKTNIPLGVKCLVVSNEDQPLMYGRRIVCRRGSFNALCVRDGDLVPEEINRIWAMQREASDSYVLMNAMGMPAEEIVEAILACREELGTELVMIDYLQRVRMRRAMQDRRNEVSRVAELLGDAIKKSAPDSRLPTAAAGLVFSQLKRTQEKPPTMEDMKESGDVENMAEHIIIGWRKVGDAKQGEENVRRLYNLPKNKDGPVSLEWTELEFDLATASFTGRLASARHAAARGEYDSYGTDGRYP